MIYLYENHLGGWYISGIEIENTYCDQCGDSDWLVDKYDIDKAGDLNNLLLDIFDVENINALQNEKNVDEILEDIDSSLRRYEVNLNVYRDTLKSFYLNFIDSLDPIKVKINDLEKELCDKVLEKE